MQVDIDPLHESVLNKKMKQLDNSRIDDKNPLWAELYNLTAQAKILPITSVVTHLLEDIKKKQEQRKQLLQPQLQQEQQNSALLGDENEDKFLVFAHHIDILDEIERVVQKHNIEYIRIDGSTSSEKRALYVNEFQSIPSKKIAILSLTAAGTGLSLQVASRVYFTGSSFFFQCFV